MTSARALVPSLVLAAGTVLAVPACSSGAGEGAGAGACPRDLPEACPEPPPSFGADVQAIVARRCGACHAGGGVAAASHDLSTYAAIYRQRGAVLNQIYACRMPLAEAPQPTPDERAKLLAWLVCGAPDN
jgi:uncharacterized membrane protein